MFALEYHRISNEHNLLQCSYSVSRLPTKPSVSSSDAVNIWNIMHKTYCHLVLLEQIKYHKTLIFHKTIFPWILVLCLAYHTNIGLKNFNTPYVLHLWIFQGNISKSSQPSPNRKISCSCTNPSRYTSVTNCGKSEYYLWLNISFNPVCVVCYPAKNFH